MHMGLYATPKTYRRRAHVEKISDAFCELGRGDYDRLLIVTPPQVGKSVTSAVFGPLWWLANNPTHKIVVASYAKQLAIARGRAIRSLIFEAGGDFGLRLDPTSRSVNDWKLTSGGGLLSVGVGSGLTGHSANVIIVDDPHKDRQEADSLRIRDNVHEWWSSVATTRLAPASPAILILTRWHPDDLAGRMLRDEGRIEEGGRWKVLHMAALAMAGDALGRPLGEPLAHPLLREDDREGMLKHWRDKRRTSTVRDWHALFQGDPRPPEGALLSADLLRDRQHLDSKTWPAAQKSAVAIDPSGGGRDTAGIIAGFRGADGKLYITHDRSGVMGSEQWAREACKLAFETDADSIVVEVNFGGDMTLIMVRSAWDALVREGAIMPEADRLPPRLVRVRSKKGKLLRAEPVAQQFMEDRVRLGAYLPDLVSEWITWQPDDSSSPGRIDASVHLAHALLRTPMTGRSYTSPVKATRLQVIEGGLATQAIPRAQIGMPTSVSGVPKPDDLPWRMPNVS